MIEQAEKFLAQWEIEHVEMVARSDREDQATRLALRCREDSQGRDQQPGLGSCC